MKDRKRTVYLRQDQVDNENVLGEIRKKYKGGLSGFLQDQFDKFEKFISKKGGEKN